MGYQGLGFGASTAQLLSWVLGMRIPIAPQPLRWVRVGLGWVRVGDKSLGYGRVMVV